MKLKFSVILLCFFCNFLVGQNSIKEVLAQHNSGSIPYVSAKELRAEQQNNKLLILDAREEAEFVVSHLPTAMYIGFEYFSSEEILQRFPDKTSAIVVYCSLGVRSEKISEKLKANGYTNVKNLYGGIFKWKNSGYPIVDSNDNETEQVHVYSEKWGVFLKKGTKVYN